MRWDTKASASAFFTSCVVLLFGLTWGLAGEVIEPTRTLQDPGKTWGGLTVFSEPPPVDSIHQKKSLIYARSIEATLCRPEVLRSFTTLLSQYFTNLPPPRKG